MAYQVCWYYQDAVILAEYYRHSTVDEINTAREEIIRLLDNASQPVQIISDWRHADNVAIRYSMRPRILDLLRHRRMGTVAFVGMNPILEFWAELFAKRSGLHYVTAQSVEEAGQMLLQINQAAAIK